MDPSSLDSAAKEIDGKRHFCISRPRAKFLSSWQIACWTKVISVHQRRIDLVVDGAFLEVRFQVTNEEQPAHTKKESHYAGDGPDFQHSLFNLGGQSPLVSYYFQMHGLPNTLANSRGYRINHSEICKVPDQQNVKWESRRDGRGRRTGYIPGWFLDRYGKNISTPLSPTYMDVIHKSIKTSRKLQNNFSDFEHKCYAELVMLQEKRERADRKFRRMLGTITTKPTEKRMKIEQFLLQMANAKIQRHGSCGSESGTKEV